MAATTHLLTSRTQSPPHQVRNSWATTFGVDGHILLSSEGNTCGLADEATFVTVAAQPMLDD